MCNLHICREGRKHSKCIFFAANAFSEENLALQLGIDLHLDTEVVKADMKSKIVTTATGDTYNYANLLIATGSTVRFQ